MKNYLGFCWTVPLLLALSMKIDSVNCRRILIISPAPSFSHQVVFQGLANELYKRGHEVVHLTPTPTKDKSVVNYREINFSVGYEILNTIDLPKMTMKYKDLNQFEINELGYYVFQKLIAAFYDHPEVKEIIEHSSENKFDLVICEGLLGNGYYAMAHILNAPLVVMASVELHMYHNYLLGSPILPSHPSNWELDRRMKPNMSFWDRTVNYLISVLSVAHWYHYNTRRQEKLVRSLVGRDLPPLMDIARNASLYMMNQDPLTGYARPLPPNVITFSGLHLSAKRAPLSTEVEEFLGNATNGFIYMSLGCNVKSSFLGPDTVKAVYNVFSRLPYKVLWKYEADDMPKNPNILTAKWISQPNVLAHPNIKLFILQGGLQSTEEGIHHGVPMVGIPVIFEQFYRVKRMETLGVGRMLDFDKINEDTFHETVYDVLTNKSYKENMMNLMRLLKDKPRESKDEVIWWLEYVMRNKGAPHLRFSGADLPFFQRYDEDVIAFLAVSLFVVTVISVIAFVRILRWIVKRARKLLNRTDSNKDKSE